ncbi:sugar phosphate isomerase/epimerase family protein [Spirosoma pollinicola]|uniref:Sugar phosphate isomerase/epimerase n=1 Tax=Spirosoma pollinicola TaxID=2057025 RepID=A0A2K8YT75_9BACT|nr:sugar phosphate isomerase/epimerase [Spirosoma pollinicola]AUD00826.1 sugar phosphate isomerase/epimerase [Spirosoma pollinicola]
MNRRDFLGATTGALALVQQPLLAGRMPLARKPVVGAHVWVFSSDKPRYDCSPVLDQVFADVKYAGFDAIELMGVALEHDDAVSKIGDLIQQTGVSVIGASHGQNLWDKKKQAENVDNAGKIIERIAQLKGRVLGLSVGDARRKKTPEEFNVQADTLRQIDAIGKQYKVVPNLHNHTYEVADGIFDLQNTLQRIPDHKLGPDLDWLFQAKVDVPTFLKTYADKIVYMHLRDHLWTGVWPEAVGEGIMDFGAISRQLKQLGFAGDMTVELAFPAGFTPTRPIRESLKMSRQVVRKHFGV